MAEMISARASYIAGRSGLAELTGTVQACVSLWENGFALADVQGTDLLTRRVMAIIGRSLALKGEFLAIIDSNSLIPCSAWDVSTKNGYPSAYRAQIAEANGARQETVLAAEVLHIITGADPYLPWQGSAPLRRAKLTASMLNVIESAISEVYEVAPLGCSIIPFPESSTNDLNALGRSFKGQRGRVLLRESVNVQAAGGPTPATDWRPASTTPDLEKALPVELLAAAREAICGVFGVLPCLFVEDGQGPAIRECQRHLAQWTLQPLAMVIAEEVSNKLGTGVMIDVMQPTQSYDVPVARERYQQLLRLW
ncbi:MAG: hypothetical protein U1E42_08485 [Rhodospirillales bacterium]